MKEEKDKSKNEHDEHRDIMDNKVKEKICSEGRVWHQCKTHNYLTYGCRDCSKFVEQI